MMVAMKLAMNESLEIFNVKLFILFEDHFLLSFEKFYISDPSRMKRVYNQSVSINERSLQGLHPNTVFS